MKAKFRYKRARVTLVGNQDLKLLETTSYVLQFVLFAGEDHGDLQKLLHQVLRAEVAEQGSVQGEHFLTGPFTCLTKSVPEKKRLNGRAGSAGSALNEYLYIPTFDVQKLA